MTRFHFEILGVSLFLERKVIWIIANLNFVDYAFKMTKCFFISGKKSYLDYSEFEFRLRV